MSSAETTRTAGPCTERGRGALVVAVDGSPQSMAAVDWAVGEARSVGGPLRLVHVIGWPHQSPGTAAAEEAEALSAQILAEAAAHAGAGQHSVVTESVWGSLGPSLLQRTGPRETLVLGHHVSADFATMALGSVSVAVATRASGPAVVVPYSPLGAWRSRRDVVVVGVDGTAPSSGVISYAFDHAARHRYEVEVVVAGASTAGRTAAVATLVDEAAAARPGVAWRRREVPGGPVEALTRVAADAALLVVGCRNDLDGHAPLLGSVSRGVLFLARCPVAVVGVPAAAAAELVPPRTGEAGEVRT